jgi:hypothetical protein
MIIFVVGTSCIGPALYFFLRLIFLALQARGLQRFSHAFYRFGTVSIVIFTFFIGGFLWVRLIDCAFERAKQYGAAIADSVVAFHSREGQWPQSKGMVGLSNDIKARTEKISNSIFLQLPSSLREENTYTKYIGGYFVWYSNPRGTTPLLQVGRRDRAVHWDFEKNYWIEGPAERQ